MIRFILLGPKGYKTEANGWRLWGRESTCFSVSRMISGQKRSLPLDVVFLRIQSFGSLQAEGLSLYVHLTDSHISQRPCAVGRGEYYSMTMISFQYIFS